MNTLTLRGKPEGKIAIDGQECLKRLNPKQPSSVIYICFALEALPTLLNNLCSYLWVVWNFVIEEGFRVC